jgi:transposase
VSTKDIAFALNVRTETVYEWIKRFKTNGLESLFDKEGRGRKSIFKDIPKDEIKKLIDTKASVSIINANIKEKYGISVSNESIRKFIKKTFV